MRVAGVDDRAVAERATAAVLQTLRKRLTFEEAAHVAARESRVRQSALLVAQLALVDLLRPDPDDPGRPADVAAAERRRP